MSSRVTIIAVCVAVVAVVAVDTFINVRRSEQVSEGVTIAAPREITSSLRAYVLPLSEPNYLPILQSDTPAPLLNARSALVYDVRADRDLFERDSRRVVPIASVTKIMTALVAREQFALTDVVTVAPTAVRVEGGKQDLTAGEQLTVEQLISMMLVGSSNDAAVALAEHAKTKGLDLVGLMNTKAQELGLTDTRFADPAGLNDEGHSTAHDVARLVAATLQIPSFWHATTEKELTITAVDGKTSHLIKATNELVGTIPNLIGGKTGFTDGAQGCLVLILDVPGYRDTLVSVVLGSSSRFEDSRRLVTWVREAYRWR